LKQTILTNTHNTYVDIESTPSGIKGNSSNFCFASKQNKIIYTRLFKLIKKHIPNFNPNIIIIDFEAATIQAIKDVFPNTQISGCNYHFNQSLWRKVQNIGIIPR